MQDDRQPSFRDAHYSAPDGLKLAARIYGKAHDDKWPVICLAGLTRNARDFHGLAEHLAGEAGGGRQVIAFDYRGRGRSAYDRDWNNYTVATETADILAGLAAFDIEHGAFIGTSRGGLIIHILAALRPSVLKAIVFNDIGPVVDGAGLAQIKAYLEHAPRPKSFAEAVNIQKSVHGKAFPALSEDDWERFTRAIYREDKGKPVADYDPNLIRTVAQWDLNDAVPSLWPQFDGLARFPLLTIRGENSLLLSEQTLRQMKEHHRAMETVIAEGQGHAPLLDTAGLPARIADFIDKAEARS